MARTRLVGEHVCDRWRGQVRNLSGELRVPEEVSHCRAVVGLDVRERVCAGLLGVAGRDVLVQLAVYGEELGPVLDLGDAQRTEEAFVAAAERAVEAGAEVLVLGCAGMTGLQRAVGEKLGLPVVDGVAAAVRLAESLVSRG